MILGGRSRSEAPGPADTGGGTGLEISHTYDDLVFVDMGAFLLRFDNAEAGKVHLHFEADCEASARKEFQLTLGQRCASNQLTLTPADDFRLEEVPGKEELRLKFLAR